MSLDNICVKDDLGEKVECEVITAYFGPRSRADMQVFKSDFLVKSIGNRMERILKEHSTSWCFTPCSYIEPDFCVEIAPTGVVCGGRLAHAVGIVLIQNPNRSYTVPHLFIRLVHAYDTAQAGVQPMVMRNGHVSTIWTPHSADKASHPAKRLDNAEYDRLRTFVRKIIERVIELENFSDHNEGENSSVSVDSYSLNVSDRKEFGIDEMAAHDFRAILYDIVCETGKGIMLVYKNQSLPGDYSDVHYRLALQDEQAHTSYVVMPVRRDRSYLQFLPKLTDGLEEGMDSSVYTDDAQCEEIVRRNLERRSYDSKPFWKRLFSDHAIFGLKKG